MYIENYYFFLYLIPKTYIFMRKSIILCVYVCNIYIITRNNIIFMCGCRVCDIEVGKIIDPYPLQNLPNIFQF